MQAAPHSPGLEGLGETLELERQSPRGRWSLEIGSPNVTTTVALLPGRSLTLGSGKAASIGIHDRTVSAVHCKVTLERHGVVVQDLGSKNGLFIGGGKVTEAVLAVSGAAFVIGRTSVVLRSRDAGEGGSKACEVPGLVGDSASMRRVKQDILQVARCRAPVLVQGESGTGKDLVARALHQLGGFKGAYVPLNAAAFPDSLSDSELFGHSRGAFTGAVSARPGAFEQADGGTLFLDEVAELSPAVQVRLLRVVEDGRVRPLGGNKETRVRVRIVSASWADLPERVAQGRFRADLYHRLATITIQLPALRDRKSDIPALCEALLARFSDELGFKTVSPGAMARLIDHDWPGNVRELGGVLYRAALTATSASIMPHDLVLAESFKKRRRPHLLDPTEARQLYELHGKNKSAAARAARVPRSTFRGWLERSA